MSKLLLKHSVMPGVMEHKNMDVTFASININKILYIIKHT